MESPEDYWKNKYLKLLKKYKKTKDRSLNLLESQSTSQTTQEVPEMSANLFESFLILGGKPNSVSVLTQYPEGLSIDNIADFAFPLGWSESFIDLSRSGTALYQLLYPSYERDNNSYIFSLNSPATGSSIGDPSIHNNDKAILYGCCVRENEVMSSADQFKIPIHPKCYCLLSYVPCFSLHFQVLYAILSIKKAKILSDYSYAELENFTIPQQEELINQEQLELLDLYRSTDILHSLFVRISLQSIPEIKMELPALPHLESEWACCLMFSVLSLDHFYQVLSAAMMEFNIVFVSSNLGALSSCVIGIQSLMKPFKCQHVVSPILPKSYYIALEAPVPFIMGIPTIPKTRVHAKNTLWVLLDERKLSHHITPELVGYDLKEYIKIAYKHFKHRCYYPDLDQMRASKKITSEIQGYWEEIIGLIPRDALSLECARNEVVKKANPYDKNFMRKLVTTQFFSHAFGELIGQNK